MEGLSTYETSQSPSEWTKTPILGAILERLFVFKKVNFGKLLTGMGCVDEVVLLFRALNHLVGVQESN